ncbi:amidohydrolase family protein [Kitasatospora sp. NPDC048365]|uniref:amidohydrolase family protein n=1 Tax=Kitasatospora sp. NPDC048365 TaxID=3364050 RepID=UPI00371FBD9A
MDQRDRVLPDGVLYVGAGGVIEAVRPAAGPPPAGFAGVPVTRTGATVYPGLIELHNHLPYDVLQLWQVPKRFDNRGQWGGTKDYRRLVTGPMTALGHDPLLMPAVVRYVEAKALLNGTTTSQGIALFSNAGARRMYRGVVRNVEQPKDPALPAAASRIADVDADDARRFLDRLNRKQRLLLHLAEGVDDVARGHFRALEFEPGRWAITENLVGIHCTGLGSEDFKILADHGGSMVWSPLSNLLLYGRTADIAAARAAGVRVALGSDWSVSGSKGLLGELKAARLAAAGAVSEQELVAMATRDAARILRWDGALGMLRPGLRADLLAVATTDADPYRGLVAARDGDIRLVAIGGTARYGEAGLMRSLVAPGARLEEPMPERLVNLDDPDGDPLVAGVTLAEATRRLTGALASLPTLGAGPGPLAVPGERPTWRLALDEIQQTGAELRPRLPFGDRPSGPVVDLAPLAALTALGLDGLTAGADAAYRTTLAGEANLPAGLRAALVAQLA